jgi:UDP-N-acetylglucosamine acyltransferase
MIHPTAIIYPNCEIHESAYIGPYCIIGAPPEDKKTFPDGGKGVVIGEGAVLHGHVTVDSGTKIKTEIMDGAWLMKGVHVGHDAVIGTEAILSCHVLIGGWVCVGQYTNIGLGAVVHQRVTIPPRCMIGMNSTVIKKSEMKDGGKYAGSPIRYIGENRR